MLERSKLEADIVDIERMIDEKYNDNNKNKRTIGDGIIDVDLYLDAEPKILWIMKEAYDENDGDWNYPDEWSTIRGCVEVGKC